MVSPGRWLYALFSDGCAMLTLYRQELTNRDGLQHDAQRLISYAHAGRTCNKDLLPSVRGDSATLIVQYRFPSDV